MLAVSDKKLQVRTENKITGTFWNHHGYIAQPRFWLQIDISRPLAVKHYIENSKTYFGKYSTLHMNRIKQKITFYTGKQKYSNILKTPWVYSITRILALSWHFATSGSHTLCRKFKNIFWEIFYISYEQNQTKNHLLYWKAKVQQHFENTMGTIESLIIEEVGIIEELGKMSKT